MRQCLDRIQGMCAAAGTQPCCLWTRGLISPNLSGCTNNNPLCSFCGYEWSCRDFKHTGPIHCSYGVGFVQCFSSAYGQFGENQASKSICKQSVTSAISLWWPTEPSEQAVIRVQIVFNKHLLKFKYHCSFRRQVWRCVTQPESRCC